MAQLLNQEDTIVAISSAPGGSARAILRASGSLAFSLVKPSFEPTAAWPVAPVRCRLQGVIKLPDWHSSLPVAILLWPAPRTYTGQDLVEIHTLGSPPLVDALLGHLLERGARPAQPGEFTLRAFLAGKLDLTQAEAVLAVIEADAPEELRAALQQLAGGVGQHLHALRDDLLSVLAEVEAGLDFAEEDITFIAREELIRRLEQDRAALSVLEHQLQERDISTRPFRVVLAGLPNAGKSSLFNALLGDATALVSSEAGTTRDYLVRQVRWQDTALELVDTAGEVDTRRDAIEDQMERHRLEALQRADLVLQCIPVTEPRGVPAARHALCVWTKCDLPHDAAVSLDEHRTSAATGAGLDELREAIIERAQGRRPTGMGTSAGRCRRHTRLAIEHLDAALALASQGAAELLALELRGALDELGEMVGTICTDDLLDRIFSRFCIGK